MSGSSRPWFRGPVTGAALLAALAGLAPLLQPSFAGVLVASAAVGLGAGVYETLLNAAVPEREPATAVGLVVGAGSVGGFVVPWAAGALGDRLGAPALLAALALLGAGIALAARAPRAAR